MSFADSGAIKGNTPLTRLLQKKVYNSTVACICVPNSAG